MAVVKAAKKTATKKLPLKSTLVIVESPHKAETIGKYLGKGYIVKASVGHLIDLPKSRMAIDIEHNFEPEYQTVRGKAKILQELQKDAKKSGEVLLASDNDREGEAIAWHLRNAIRPKTDASIKRIVFNEITPQAIKDAIQNPTDINEAKVNAQKARRVLDRLVGYKLSPLLQKKVKSRTSAGRVQSVALRLICEREVEVENFIPEEYWTLEADFLKGKSKFAAQLVQYRGAKPELKDEKSVTAIIDEIKKLDAAVSDVKVTDKTIRPKPPFTTSTLQQTAVSRLGFTARKTMQVAQILYQGVNVGKSPVGLITYMRTDSVRIAESALTEVREWIGGNFAKDLPPEAIQYAVGAKAQDAHEGIRPTYVSYTPEYLKDYLDRDQLKLYTIIWERFVSSQMVNAKSRTTSVEIAAGDAVFRASATKLTEKGFYNVLKLLSSKEDETASLPALAKGDAVKSGDFRPEQHFTQGPARYSESAMIKTLEDLGIGRPSTYASIIGLLDDRYYVKRTNKQLVPTQLGRIVNDLLVKTFPEVINVNFTADMEKELDLVEEESGEWTKVLSTFFFPFNKKVDEAMDSIESIKGSFDEKTDLLCEKCGKPMVKKLGRFGYFLACSGFPECRNAKSIPLAKCPKCGGDIVARKTKGRGKEFYGCTNYPTCDFLSHFKPISSNCPKCGWFMVEKYDKKHGSSHKSCINPDCDYLHTAEDEGESA